MMLVDSDVLIAHLRGAEAVRDLLVATRRSSKRITASVVTCAEIAGGMRSAARGAVASLFSALDLVGVDRAIAHRSGELQRTYRRSHTGIGLADTLIAATAQVIGADLATLNVRHFPMFTGLQAPFPLPG